jgi:hypothetical protein
MRKILFSLLSVYVVLIMFAVLICVIPLLLLGQQSFVPLQWHCSDTGPIASHWMADFADGTPT